MQKTERQTAGQPAQQQRAIIEAARLAQWELLDLQLREHLALDALAHGAGQLGDVQTLQVSAAVAHELAAMGYGREESAIVGAVGQALCAAIRSEAGAAVLFLDPARMLALRQFVAYHDAQREAVTRHDYVRALARVRHRAGILAQRRVG